MNRLMIASLCVAGLLGAPACATRDTAGSASTPAYSPPTAQTTSVGDRYCLRRTGSQIYLRDNRDDRSGQFDQRCLAYGGRVYTREDLERTGEIDIADALRKLDPSIR